MKVSESGIEKIIIAIQAVLVAGYVWFAFHQEIKQKQKNAKNVQGIREKELIRYTKASFKQKRKNLKKNKKN